MSNSLGPTTRYVRDGEPVTAGVDGRPVRTIEGKVNYLWNMIQSLANGQSLTLRRVTIAETLLVGQPVFFNADTSQFEAAIGRLTSSDGLVVLSGEARVVGIVKTKHSATLADITLSGVETIDITEALGSETLVAGVYYLSNSAAGRLTSVKPPVVIGVLESLGNGQVIVRPDLGDPSDSHTHYSFQLASVPAGTHTPPIGDDNHVISLADPDTPGWLPADDPVFAGLAPVGAAFGYNLSMHPALQVAWPPPAGQAYLEWDRETDEGFAGVPSSFFTVDRNGLWWMTSCNGEVPWPADLDTTAGSESASESAASCPPPRSFEVRLWFSRLQYATANAVVTSLVAADDRVRVRCTGGVAGAVGDLEVSLTLPATQETGDNGATALKQYDPDTSIFTVGPVAAGLYTVGANVTLTGDATASIGGNTVHSGIVGIGVDTQPTKQLETQLYRGDGATTEFYRDVPYLGFPAARNVNIRGRIRVPDDLSYSSPEMRLRIRIIGSVASDLPALTVTARRLPAPPDGITTPVDLPDDSEEFAVTIDTEATLTGTYQYVDAVSDWFDVAAGETVLFSVIREGETDGYAGIVGILETAADVRD